MSESMIFMYSGQGSQYYQMGKTLIQRKGVFQESMQRMDRLIQAWTGQSILAELYHPGRNSGEPFTRTLHTHPAIFMVEYALTEELMVKGIFPKAVIGASMGEFAAAAAAGAIPVETALHAVLTQAQMLESVCPAGGMLAILDRPDLFSSSPFLHNNSEMVSAYGEKYFVVAGECGHIDRIERDLKAQGVSCQRLPVTQGFHSSVIDAASGRYKDFLRQITCKPPNIPFISSCHGTRMDRLPNDYFWQAVRAPIRLTEAIACLLENYEEEVFLDLGPSGTMINLMNLEPKGREHAAKEAIMTPFHQDVNHLEKIVSVYSSFNQPSVKKENSTMLAFVFPGQGSQKVGMGAALFEEFPDITEQADTILGYSITSLCLEDKERQQHLTQYTQPALYTVNALMYLKKIKVIGRKPDAVAGHSLGEYNALFAAGVFDFATGLTLVKKRGELMSRALGGGMAAVIGLTHEKIEGLLAQHRLTELDIANYNAPQQIVIAGLLEDIQRAQPLFEAAGATFIPLKVSGAFHSRYMGDAGKEFERFLSTFTFSKPEIPVISNINARPYRSAEIQQNLTGQISHSVRWCETVQVLRGMGALEIEEVGPGSVLSGLIKKIVQETEPIFLPADVWLEKEPDLIKADEPIKTIPVAIDDTAGFSAQDEVSGEQTRNGAPAIFSPETLGSEEFKMDYNLKYAYLTGAMYKGIASKELVVKIGKAGMMGFLGTGGLEFDQIREAIQYIQRELSEGQSYGMNLLHQPNNPEKEDRNVELFLQYGVTKVEASAFMGITPALIKFRAHGLRRGPGGNILVKNRIIAKVSRPEVAEVFLSPAPERLLAKMVQENRLSPDEAELLKEIPMADDLCLEADSGGHTDGGAAIVLMPAIRSLRDEIMKKYRYRKKIRLGAAGGIGTPEAAAAAFIMGADFITTGSINQCTVEAGTSDAVKDLLQQMNIQDTDYAPAGDMFELGAKIQVLSKGVFFPARANKLYDLYRHCSSVEEIEEKTKKQLEEKYFKRSFEEVYHEVKNHVDPLEIEKAERNPKHKMALIFRWYFAYTTRLAMSGTAGEQVNYQIHCGPALGAFNQRVKGTPLENWRNRHVDDIAIRLMADTVELLNRQMRAMALSSE